MKLLIILILLGFLGCSIPEAEKLFRVECIQGHLFVYSEDSGWGMRVAVQIWEFDEELKVSRPVKCD